MSARILIVLLLYLIPCTLNAQNEGKECMPTKEPYSRLAKECPTRGEQISQNIKKHIQQGCRLV